MKKVILLIRFDSNADVESVKAYGSIKAVNENELLKYQGKILTDRMTYKRFQAAGKSLLGDTWRLVEMPIIK